MPARTSAPYSKRILERGVLGPATTVKPPLSSRSSCNVLFTKALQDDEAHSGSVRERALARRLLKTSFLSLQLAHERELAEDERRDIRRLLTLRNLKEPQCHSSETSKLQNAGSTGTLLVGRLTLPAGFDRTFMLRLKLPTLPVSFDAR